MRLSKFSFVLGAASSLLLMPNARATDHTNLEEGLPTQVEDTTVIPYKGREFQIQGTYERTANGDNRYIALPRLELGIHRNAQLRLDVPLYFGAQTQGRGDVRAEYFYNFNKETLRTPAFGISARLAAPTGRDSNGLDTQYRFLVSKYLGSAQKLQRVHLNLIYFNNASARDSERRNGYAAIFGYSQRLNPDTMLIADYVRRQEVERGRTTNLLELGIRRQVTPLRVVSLGVGAGIGSDSPDIRLTLGVQQTF